MTRVYIDLRYGIVGVRWGGALCRLKAPWCRPLWSERNGRQTPLFRLCGWRLFFSRDAA
jgi:hypothetical protein